MPQLHEGRTQSGGVPESHRKRQRRGATRTIYTQLPYPPRKAQEDVPGTSHLAPATEAPPHARMAGAIQLTVEGDVPKEEDTLFAVIIHIKLNRLLDMHANTYCTGIKYMIFVRPRMENFLYHKIQLAIRSRGDKKRTPSSCSLLIYIDQLVPVNRARSFY